MTPEPAQPVESPEARWLGCTLPPEGWWCSREEGHEGPCAARPDEAPEEDGSPLSDADKARIDAAWENYKAVEPAQPAESPEARAWSYRLATCIASDGTYSKFDETPRISLTKPNVPEGSIRDLTPLFAATTARPTERGAVDCDCAARFYGDDRNAHQLCCAALTAPVTVAATDQAGEVERLRELSDAATVGPWKLFEYLRGAFEICQADNYASGGVGQAVSRANGEFIVACVNHVRAALDTKSATGRTMGGEERKWKAALQDIAEAEAIPNDAVAFVWCRDVARAALQNGVE